MKTPPELTPEYRATLAELRQQCEAFLKRRAALMKKLATESVIEAKVAMRLALLGTLAEHPGDPKSVEELHGRKLQKALLGRTMDEGRQKLAFTLQKGDEVLENARRAVKEALRERFGKKLPTEAELLDPTADPEDAGRNLVDVLTFLLGDGEARAERERQYNETVARITAERRGAKAVATVPTPRA